MQCNGNLVQIVTVGNSNTGKTALIRRFCKDVFDENSNNMSTIGIDFMQTTYKTILSNEELLIKCWDTAGQERF